MLAYFLEILTETLAYFVASCGRIDFGAEGCSFKKTDQLQNVGASLLVDDLQAIHRTRDIMNTLAPLSCTQKRR